MLILGGSGFIGSNLVKALCVSNVKVKVLSLGPNTLPFYPTLEYIEGSFLDKNILDKALDGVTTVYHLISTTNPSTSNLNPVADINTNLIGLIGLLDLMVAKKVFKIVFISSGGTVYGEPLYTPIDIHHPLKPICSYGVVKVAMENYLHMYSQLYGIKATILRVANPYGPGQSATKGQGVIADFMHKIKSDTPIEVWGDGSSVRDYIYIDDLISICVIAEKTEIVGTFNVGSGTGKSVNEIISSIELITGLKANVNYIKARRFDVKSVVLDISETKKSFPWKINYDLFEGIKKYHEWLTAMDTLGERKQCSSKLKASPTLS
jgi:UDP-glucose 4-epimerase